MRLSLLILKKLISSLFLIRILPIKSYDLFDDNSLFINAQNLGYEQIEESCYTCSSLNAQMLSEIVNDNDEYKAILEDLKQDKTDILSQEMNKKYNKKNIF